MAASLVISCNKKSSKTASDRSPMMLLKDYLLDDMSSCSSNGFKSFPRRRGQCCSPTVRFLIDADLAGQKRRRSRKGTIRKASEAVINAVKLLQPFPSSSSAKSSTTPLSKLPRSFSRKLFKRGYFWRKLGADKERDVRKWTYFHVEPDRTPMPEKLISAACSEGSGNDVVVEEEKNWTTEREKVSAGEEPVSNVGGVDQEDGHTNKEWHNVDKEQFSPVSVLDCPFEDEEDITSPFNGTQVHFEGTQKKLMGKLMRFESFTKLEPVDLRKRFQLADESESPRTTTITTTKNHRNPISPELLDENRSEEKAKELLRPTEAKVSPQFRTTTSNVDNLLLDFFMEQIERENPSPKMAVTGGQEYEDELALARDWLSGKPREVILGWEVEGGRKMYLSDMERHWVSRSLEEKEEGKAEVALELESEALNLLMEEVLVDLYGLS